MATENKTYLLMSYRIFDQNIKNFRSGTLEEIAQDSCFKAFKEIADAVYSEDLPTDFFVVEKGETFELEELNGFSDTDAEEYFFIMEI